MKAHALFDFTPGFCPDCGREFTFDFADDWFDYRTGNKHICPFCDFTFYFVRDLETIIQRIQDEKKENKV